MPFSNQQTDFRGGIWSPSAQGREDDPEFRRALNESLNGMPLQNGAWTRRPGWRTAAFTRTGASAKVMSLSVTGAPSHVMEFTDEHIRIFEGTTLLTEATRYTVSGVSSAKPAVITTDANDFADGNHVVFNVDTATSLDDVAALIGRVLLVNQLTSTTFSITDAVTGAQIDGADITLGSNVITVARVVDLTTPYVSGDWASTNVVQEDNLALLLNEDYAPQQIAITYPSLFPTFEIDEANFVDGPYLDAHAGSWAIPDGVNGTIHLTLSAQEYDAGKAYNIGDMVHDTTFWLSLTSGNIGNTPASSPNDWQSVSRAHFVNEKTGLHAFSASDVGRHVRLYSQPAEWDEDDDEGYEEGDVVWYNNAAWVALQDFPVTAGDAELNVQSYVPGDDARTWAVKSNASRWTWGKITGINESSTDITVVILGDPLLYNDTIRVWRLGRYNATEPTWPIAGCYAGGRLWLASSDNHFDTNNPGLPGLIMSPSETDGTVTDGNAISGDFDSQAKNKILWMAADERGVVAGTGYGEWVISADGVITPTNRTARLHTRFGSSAVPPVETDFATIFVHKNSRTMHELFRDAYSGKLVAPTLQEHAPHLTKGGIVQMAYQSSLTPILWACTGEDKLIGSTYRRESLLSERPPTYNGWHRHTHGAGRVFVSVAASKSLNALGDTLAVVTKDKGTGYHRVELLSDPMEDEDDIFACNFLDGFLGASRGSFYGDEGTEVQILGQDGYWSAPGWTLTTQWDPKQGYDPPAGVRTNADTATMLAKLTLNPAEKAVGDPNFSSYSSLIGRDDLDHYLTPPSNAAQTYPATNHLEVPGIDALLPNPVGNDFVILGWSLPGSTPSGIEGWYHYQYWQRVDADVVPVQPLWSEPIEPSTQIINVGKPQGFSLSGLHNFEGTYVAAFICGIDCGDFVVTNGKITVPYDTANELFTHRLVQQVSALNRDWGILTLTIDGKYNVPAIVGYRYDSRGQRLRPNSPVDAGTRSGPGFGKKRRNSSFAALLHNAKGVKFGTEFDRMNAAQLRSPGQAALSAGELYSGVLVDTIGDDSSYDGMIAWQNDRTPYPTMITCIGGFLETSEK